MNRRYNDDQIRELHSQGLSDREIAEIVGCTPNQMARKRNRLGLSPNNKKKSYIMSDQEIAILIGTLLGDACIRYIHKGCTAPALDFSHCCKQKEYFLYKKDKLINLMSSFNSYNKKDSFHPGEYKETFQFVGKNLDCLIPIRNIFYPNGIKIIPMNFINKYFTEESIYY